MNKLLKLVYDGKRFHIENFNQFVFRKNLAALSFIHKDFQNMRLDTRKVLESDADIKNYYVYLMFTNSLSNMVYVYFRFRFKENIIYHMTVHHDYRIKRQIRNLFYSSQFDCYDNICVDSDDEKYVNFINIWNDELRMATQ